MAYAHNLHENVLDEPGRLVANTHVAHQLKHRDVVLGLDQQINDAGQLVVDSQRWADGQYVALLLTPRP